ncbi:MAG TPA: GTP 3',8-cyclase MoaA [Polyangiaceae bacterium]|nr:GTP 3',8-cyclase MoaA [Polyangiaceae bacterium]
MDAKPQLPVLDRRERPLRELRVSVTDRCNLRCSYCMPREAFGSDHRFLPRAEILSFEEIYRTCRVLTGLGVRKVRITGGEPLLRAELPKLVRMLAALPDVDLALTTNGSLLERYAAPLRDAGLGRVTVSLDSLDPDVFRKMSDSDVSVAQVLRGVEAALRVGLRPVKINAVVRRGVNDGGVIALAKHFKGTGVVVRFIEYMDVGSTNRWQPADVVPAARIVERIAAELPLAPCSGPSGVAERYRYADGSGEIGVIASVTAPFCGTCSRARLSADGRLFTCLFATAGVDLRPALRDAEGDAELADLVRRTWQTRTDRYSELRASAPPRRRIEMSYIGG